MESASRGVPDYRRSHFEEGIWKYAKGHRQFISKGLFSPCCIVRDAINERASIGKHLCHPRICCKVWSRQQVNTP